MVDTPNSPIQPAAPAKPRRRWFRFSLRTMLVFVTLAGCALGWLGAKLREARRQQVAAAAIRSLGGEVEYDYEFDSLGNYTPNATPPGSAWLHALFGDDFFRKAQKVSVQVRSGSFATVAELQQLSGLTTLKWLDLSNSYATDARLEHIKGLTQLESLDLHDIYISDAGLKHLKGLVRLRKLRLDRTLVTDAGLAYLAGLANLEELSLNHTQTTDAGLEQLAGLSKLRHLEICRTRVTDAGLVYLARFKELESISVGGSGVTSRGPSLLKQAIPAGQSIPIVDENVEIGEFMWSPDSTQIINNQLPPLERTETKR